MNIGQIKFLAWLSAALLTAGLAYYVFTFVKGFNAMRGGVDPKQIEETLKDTGPPEVKADDLVNYDDVRRLLLPSCEKCKTNPNCKHFNWTGKQIVVAPPDDGGTPPPVKVTPVKELVRVLMVKVDLADEKGSSVFLKYRSAASVTAKSPTGGFQFKVGEHLHAPNDAVQVKAITPDGVVFTFGSEREDETLGPGEFDSKTQIVMVDASGIMQPKLTSSIPKGPTETWTPERTTALGNGKYRIGTEDAKEFAQNWDTILAREVQPERHKDPRTGKYDGIEIKSVAPGSLAARHGVQEGDIVKSINGTPVTSTQEAIQFAKNHKDQYSTWEVVVENKGRTRTLTYHTQNH